MGGEGEELDEGLSAWLSVFSIIYLFTVPPVFSCLLSSIYLSFL